jgi:hypothetical protein
MRADAAARPFSPANSPGQGESRLSAWALGQLGAGKELEDLARYVATMFLVEAVN